MMMVVMVSLTKSTLVEKIREAGALTDVDLHKSMAKDGHVIPDDRFNKYLLDLEIMGLVRVAWVTKDERRIEAVAEESEYYGHAAAGSSGGGSRGSDSNGSGAGGDDTSYEASFPGLER